MELNQSDGIISEDECKFPNLKKKLPNIIIFHYTTILLLYFLDAFVEKQVLKSTTSSSNNEAVDELTQCENEVEVAVQTFEQSLKSTRKKNPNRKTGSGM